MKSRALRCVAVSVSPATEDAICELLARVFAAPTAVFTNLETGRSQAQVYVMLAAAVLGKKRRNLKAGLQRIGMTGRDTPFGKITCRKLKPQDWAESWKRHFKPLEIGGQLLIKPSWSRRKPRAGAKVIILDPGLSFGTGQHPTTQFCLEQLAHARRFSTRQSFLDIGTGTGILAIAAEKLGYEPVVAFDFDPDAVRIARSNAELNDAGRIRFSRKDLTNLRQSSRESYDVVCANLTYDLLIAERERVIRKLKRSGILVLAGILKTQFKKVAAVYEEKGLLRIRRRAVNEWCSGTFQFDVGNV